MTENKGDLISREALKKEIENLVVGGAEGLKDYYENGSKSDENAWIGGVYDAWELIDNAPTVEVPENKVNCVLTMFGKCSYNETGCSDCEIKDKIHKALSARPQGEWKFSQGVTTQGSLKCPFCDYRDYHNTNSNYCPNCGADMRKGGAV